MQCYAFNSGGMNRRATAANKKKNKSAKKSKVKKRMKKRTIVVTVHTQTKTLVLLRQRPHTCHCLAHRVVEA